MTFVAVAAAGTFAACSSPPHHSAAYAPSDLASDTIMNGSGGRKLPSREGGGMPEGIARVHGQYYYVHNAQGVLLTQRQNFMQGVTFDRQHRVILRDGTIVRLIDGDMVTFSGDRIPFPPGTQLP